MVELLFVKKIYTEKSKINSTLSLNKTLLQIENFVFMQGLYAIGYAPNAIYKKN